MDEYLSYIQNPGPEIEQSEWFDIENYLEREQEKEKKRIETQIEEINNQIQQLIQVKEQNVEELKEKIQEQSGRVLEGRSPDEEIIRDRLEKLYNELRTEKRRFWENKQELLQEKRELERELREVQDSDLSELLD